MTGLFLVTTLAFTSPCFLTTFFFECGKLEFEAAEVVSGA
jgi:hypothetical protein